MISPNIPVVNAGNLYVQGLKLTWQATTPALALPTISVQAGSCRDSQNIDDIILPAPVTLVVNQFGANGLDINAYNPATPSKLYTNSFYYVYLIGDSTEYQPTAVFLSLDFVPNQPSAPTVVGKINLPLGYDMYRRIGYVFTTNDTIPVIQGFSQYGSSNLREMWYFNLLRGFTYAGGASPILFTPNEIAQGVPFGPTSYEAIVIVDYIPTAAPNFIEMSSYEALPITTVPTSTGMIKFGCGDAAAIQNIVLTIPTSPDPVGYPAVWYKSTAAGDSVTVSVVGYKDYL